MIFIKIYIIFLIILIGSVNNSFAEIESVEIGIKNITDSTIKLNSTIKSNSIDIEIIPEGESKLKEESNLKEESKITILLEEIKEKVKNHDEVSFIQSITSNLVGIIGGLVGLAGIVLTIRQISIDNKRKEIEQKKIENAENKIKWTLGDILEYEESLIKNPPADNKLKSILAWNRVKERVKVLRIVVTPIAKDLKDDLGDYLLGYIVFLEKQFERADKDEKISLSSIINSTKRILDKHFPDHQQERTESREAEYKNFEEQMTKIREQEMEAYERYMEEQGIVDDMVEEQAREAQAEEDRLSDESADKERRAGEEDFTIDQENDDEK